jgi:hypothetical protein
MSDSEILDKVVSAIIHAAGKTRKHSVSINLYEMGLAASEKHRVDRALKRLRHGKVIKFLQTEDKKTEMDSVTRRPVPVIKKIFCITILPGFTNWYHDYILSKVDFGDIEPFKDFVTLYKIVLAIETDYKLTRRAQVKLRQSAFAKHCNRQSFEKMLRLLKNNGVIVGWKLLSDIDGFFELSLNHGKFLIFERKITAYWVKVVLGELPTKEEAQWDPWEKIQIRLPTKENHPVKIKLEDPYGLTEEWRATSTDMGFEDKKTRKPNSLWDFLYDLAWKPVFLNGTNKENDRWKQRKKSLARTLQNYFKLEGDPFRKYSAQDGYKLKIKLTHDADTNPRKRGATTPYDEDYHQTEDAPKAKNAMLDYLEPEPEKRSRLKPPTYRD